ncbi:hypothetical protein JCM5350_005441 [Sporobolomyces pararoseus]
MNSKGWTGNVREEAVEIHELKIVQQPIRARMCGFGDKDRRPITPPLIVKLESSLNGRTINPSEVDATKFVLAVDLRNGSTLEDANLVPPSFSSTASQATIRGRKAKDQHRASSHRDCSSLDPLTDSSLPKALPSGLVDFEIEDRKPSIPDSSHSPSLSEHCEEPPGKRRRLTSPLRDKKSGLSQFQEESSATLTNPALPSLENYDDDDDNDEELRTPNLIGTLHANSHILKDPDGAGSRGIYFVLPDLSVRMEGNFRLRLRLLSLDLSRCLAGSLSPVIISTHTDEFQVFNAKKFPGMLGPTPLSRHFAAQGVRIPTRQSKKSSSASPPLAPIPEIET